MNIVKKFDLALKLNDLTYASFAREVGFSKQAISSAALALKKDFTFSARVEQIIIDYTNEQMKRLIKLLDADKAA